MRLRLPHELFVSFRVGDCNIVAVRCVTFFSFCSDIFDHVVDFRELTVSDDELKMRDYGTVEFFDAAVDADEVLFGGAEVLGRGG